MNIMGSTRLVITGLAIAPAGATAYVNVAASSDVTFSDLHLDGGAGGAGAAIWLTPDALGVVIKDSTFLHCASPMCIRASSPDVLIEHNVFDDLDDSDAVHGFGGGVIRYNRMDHALPAGDGNHNDFIQIGNGGPWTIDGNWFGVRTGGAATIWVDSIDKGVIHDVLIQNNVLTGHYVGQDVGIFIAGDDRQVALLPSNVRVLNNTVASGLLNSLRFGAHYADIPIEQRPLVANNVGERLRGMCDRIRSENNVFADGEACTASDVIGDAALAPDGAPDGRQRVAAGQGRSAGHASAGLLRLHARQRARHRCDRARRVPSPGAAAGCSGRHARHLHHAGQAAAQVSRARPRARGFAAHQAPRPPGRGIRALQQCRAVHGLAARARARLLDRLASRQLERRQADVARTAHGSPEGAHPGGRRGWCLGSRDHDPGAAQLTTTSSAGTHSGMSSRVSVTASCPLASQSSRFSCSC